MERKTALADSNINWSNRYYGHALYKEEQLELRHVIGTGLVSTGKPIRRRENATNVRGLSQGGKSATTCMPGVPLVWQSTRNWDRPSSWYGGAPTASQPGIIPSSVGPF